MPCPPLAHSIRVDRYRLLVVVVALWPDGVRPRRQLALSEVPAVLWPPHDLGLRCLRIRFPGRVRHAHRADWRGKDLAADKGGRECGDHLAPRRGVVLGYLAPDHQVGVQHLVYEGVGDCQRAAADAPGPGLAPGLRAFAAAVEQLGGEAYPGDGVPARQGNAVAVGGDADDDRERGNRPGEVLAVEPCELVGRELAGVFPEPDRSI